MTGNRNRTLVVLSVLAVAAFSLDLLGWLGWVSATHDLALAPEDGAERLIDGRLLSFPPAVQRSRRLSVRALRTLPTSLAVEILERTAVAQRRWIVVHPAWATNTARGYLLTGLAQHLSHFFFMLLPVHSLGSRIHVLHFDDRGSLFRKD